MYLARGSGSKEGLLADTSSPSFCTQVSSLDKCLVTVGDGTFALSSVQKTWALLGLTEAIGIWPVQSLYAVQCHFTSDWRSVREQVTMKSPGGRWEDAEPPAFVHKQVLR